MQIDQSSFGIDPNAPFTNDSWLLLEKTIAGNETLEELAIQGHGLNNPPATKYDGYTTDFQNRVDGVTYFVGGGSDNGELAIPDLFDDNLITHAAFPTVENNGTLTQLNQNGNREDPLTTQVAGINQSMFDQVYVPADFSTVASATGPVVLVACYAEGTGILTEFGERPIETLREGDRVVTAGGALRPVRWTGYRTVDLMRHRRPQDVMPVRVRAHAFGPGRPARDLVLSPDHAVFVPGDGAEVLIPVRYLLNGASIVQERARRVTWWHVELDAHDVVLAQGLPCESYLDTGNRHAFSNGGAAVQLHPDFSRGVWAAQGCAELALNGRHVVVAKQRLIDASATATSEDPAIRITADGRPLAAVVDGPRWRVHVPAAAVSLRIASRRWTPAHMRAADTDTRRLGVALSQISLDGAAIRLDDPRLSSGWLAPEAEWRWTDGDAGMALAGGGVLGFRLAMTGSYWQKGAGGRKRRSG